MEKVVFPFEYGIGLMLPLTPILLLVAAVVTVFSVEYSSDGDYPKVLDFYGRYVALLWPTFIVGVIFSICLALDTDSQQNERDNIALREGFDTVLAGQKLTPEDKVEIDQTLRWSNNTGEETQAITLSMGSVEMAGNQEEQTMSLTFYPEEER